MIGADVAEDFLFLLPLKEVRARDWAAFDRRLHAMNMDELVGVAVGERAKQNAVDDAEDRGVCADTEGESYDCDGGEARLLEKHARRVANVF